MSQIGQNGYQQGRKKVYFFNQKGQEMDKGPKKIKKANGNTETNCLFTINYKFKFSSVVKLYASTIKITNRSIIAFMCEKYWDDNQ